MQKIFCNNRFNRLLISIIIFFLIFNFLYPNISKAKAIAVSGNSATGSIQDIIDSFRTTTKLGYQTLADHLGSSKKQQGISNVEIAVKNKLKEKFSSLTDTELDKVYRDNLNNQEKIKVKVNLYGNQNIGYALGIIDVIVNLTQENIDKALNKSNEELEDVKTDSVNEVGYGAVGEDPDGAPTVNTDTGEITSGFDNIYTGVILEPLLEFFTFFVDSIMTIIGNVMTDQDIEFVMQENAITEGTVGATITEDNEDAYANFIGNINVKYPNFTYSPEEIFSGNISLLDINFISENNSNEGWQKIRTTIASWYKALRLFAIVGLLSILIYTGIKIIISATAQDKAKYKERILNWFVALILLFTMHYIMAFILFFIGEISNLLGELNGLISVTIEGGNMDTFKTNLIGWARFQIQQKLFMAKVGFFVIYIALAVYTFKFTFLYIKRMLNMAFLTLIAPLVALMYPIDKMDGKAKAFEIWLKDYIYNALLQPMHHLLYYILVSTSLTLAAKNPVYGIVAIAFVSQAERLLKSIFGFGRAKGGTVGGIAGAYATGRVVSSLTSFIRNPLHIGNSKKGSGNGKGSNGQNEDGSLPFTLIDDTNVENTFVGSSNGANVSTDAESQDAENVEVITLSNGNASINLDNNNMDINKLMEEYRKMLLQSDIDLSQLGFKDELERDLQQLLEQIAANQEKLNNAEKLGLTEEEIEKINEEVIRDKNMLKNGIWASELPFLLEQIPLQYLDRDNRSSEQISDDILKYMEMAKNSKYTSEQQKQYLDLANKDTQLLNRRMSENTYIDNLRRNGNNGNNINTQRLSNPNPVETVNREESTDNVKKSRIVSGLANVGKELIKPVWDTDKEIDVNAGNLVKNVAKGATGLAVGATAAAVQAGISITDGKYNVFEGVGTFAAGAAGGAKLVDAAVNSKDSLKGQETIQDYAKRWYNRDDVIRDYNLEYGDKSKDMRQRARDEYISRGITDFKEQKQGMKFADQLVREGMTQEEADKLAVATIKYKQDLIKEKNYSMIYDQKKRDKYLEAKVDQYIGNKSKTSIRNVHDEFIEYVRKFDKINNI